MENSVSEMSGIPANYNNKGDANISVYLTLMTVL